MDKFVVELSFVIGLQRSEVITNQCGTGPKHTFVAASLNAFCSKLIAAEAAFRISIWGEIKRREVILEAITRSDTFRWTAIGRYGKAAIVEKRPNSHLVYLEGPVSH